MHDDYLADKRILLVDSFQQIRVILYDILKRGIGVGEVAEAADGSQALEVMRSFVPDVIVTDSATKPMDGLEFSEKVRAGENGVNPYTPIIMLSAHTEVAEIVGARDVGVNEFLAKPVSAKLLGLRIHAVLQHPRTFVRSDDFFGPDRRRKSLRPKGGERRAANEE